LAQILSYRDLEAWQRAMDLADEGYDLLESLPRKEMFRAREPDAPGIRIGSGEHR
jgi:hypothetical protein